MKRFLVAAVVLIAVISVVASAAGIQEPGTQQSARFYVTGFVKSPGSYAHSPSMTVRQGLALAGGLAERGSDRGLKIVRQVADQRTELDVTLSDVVEPNDVIHVRQRLQ